MSNKSAVHTGHGMPILLFINGLAGRFGYAERLICWLMITLQM